MFSVQLEGSHSSSYSIKNLKEGKKKDFTQQNDEHSYDEVCALIAKKI